jgi:hypothetical protein
LFECNLFSKGNLFDFQKLGQGALIGKDIESAFRLVPCYPGDFDLLGLKIGDQFYLDKCLPMGYAGSCQIFETFSKFLHWPDFQTKQVKIAWVTWHQSEG